MGLDEIVDDYEQQFADDSQVRIEDFVPSQGDPARSEVLAELIRVDLELRWKKGAPRTLADYRSRFPEEFQSEGFLAPLAFEEYRVRLLLGDSVKRSEYAEHWGCDVSDWPDESVGSRRGASGEQSGRGGAPNGGGRSDASGAAGAGRLEEPPGSAISRDVVSAKSLSDLADGSGQRGGEGPRRGGRGSARPDPVGQAIYSAQSELGVEIVELLGRGASARVYLARQPSLANRLVVLKFTTETTVEADRLARLQHTNIVPLYSYHELGEMRVLCMPFLGRYVLKEWVDQLHVQGVAPDDNVSLLTTVRTQAQSGQKTGPDLGETRSNLLESRDSVDSVDQRYLETTSRLVRDPSREAGLLKLKGGSYCDTVLWVAGRLASGMAHAHDHGILHLDIKPGNILITDEGQPMLLDFHLSTLRHSEGLENPVVGGTLLYMSPEQILAFRDRASVDERSDIYSLGVVLYELLTGRLPFVTGRSGTSWDDLQRMLEVRTKVPLLREHNRQVSPAAESIVRHCLAYRPEDRYQSAHELAHDLHSHLQHLPLRHALNPSVRELVSKWVRRHPRLMSAGGIGTLSLAGLGILGTTAALRGHQLAENSAKSRFVEFAEQARKTSAQLSLVNNNFAEATREIDRSVELLEGLGYPIRRLLTIPANRPANELQLQPATWRSTVFYQLLSTSEREQMEEASAEMLFLIGEVVSHRREDGEDHRAAANKALEINLLTISCFSPTLVPAAVWDQRARFYRLLGDQEQADQARLQAEANAGPSRMQERLEGLSHLILQNQEAAARSLARLTNQSPQDLSLWFFSGNNQVSGNLLDEAEASYTACIALSPKWHLGWWQRGTIRLMGKQYQKAYDDYTVAHELDPSNLDTLRNRALCLEAMGRYEEAIEDCTKAIQQGFSQTRIYFLRSRLFERVGRTAEGEVDRREGLTRTPTDVESWIVRGVARMGEDPKGAEQDFREAIRWDPTNSAAHRNLALVLVEHLGREAEALEVLDEFIKTSRIDDGLVWLGRGVLRARKGELAAAREDARRGLALNRQPIAVYQAACIEALDPKPSIDGLRRTIELLTEAFRGDPSLIAIAVNDGDLKYIQDKRLFKDLVSLMRFVSPKE